MAEQIFHIGIKALVVNQDTKLCMLKEVFPDGGMQWDIPGGRMEPGETFENTLRRELREEIGIEGYMNAKHFATTLSNKQIKTEHGPVALEKGVEIHWQTVEKAASLLLDKYPEEFVEKIKELNKETLG